MQEPVGRSIDGDPADPANTADPADPADLAARSIARSGPRTGLLREQGADDPQACLELPQPDGHRIERHAVGAHLGLVPARPSPSTNRPFVA